MTSATDPRTQPGAWMSAADVMRETRLSRSEAYELMNNELHGFTVGERSLRVSREDFEAWRMRVEAGTHRTRRPYRRPKAVA